MNGIFKSGIFWTIVTASLGIIATVTYYELGKKERSLSYYVKKEPSKIFDSENTTSKIQVYTDDSVRITKNVYVTNLVLWNSGDLEIKKTDVRKPIHISLSNGVRILDFNLVREIERGISNFQLIKENNELTLDWDYFDPNFGMELQIIYTGNDKSEVGIDGYVLGSEIKEKKNVRLDDSNLIAQLLAFLVFIIIYIIIINIMRYTSLLKNNSLWFNRYEIFFGIIAGMLANLFFTLIHMGPKAPL